MISTLSQREFDIELIDLATVEHFVNFIIHLFYNAFCSKCQSKKYQVTLMSGNVQNK